MGLPLMSQRPPRWDTAEQEHEEAARVLVGHPTAMARPGRKSRSAQCAASVERAGREPQPSARRKTSKIKPSAGSLLTNKQQRCCCYE